LSFNGIREEKSIKLDWVTTNETNVSHFELQRSFNGTEFEKIENIAAKNNLTINQYSTLDNSLQAVNSITNIFYRLKMIDDDGKFNYSKVVLIQPAKQSSISVFPNPAKNGKLFIKLDGYTNRKVSVNIQDVTGKIYRTINAAPVAGNIALDVDDIAAGMYFVKIIIDGTVKVYPLIITN
jgi:hypothetical protein